MVARDTPDRMRGRRTWVNNHGAPQPESSVRCSSYQRPYPLVDGATSNMNGCVFLFNGIECIINELKVIVSFELHYISNDI